MVEIEGPLVIEIESMVTRNRESVHVTPLLPYQDAQRGTDLTCDDIEVEERSEMHFEKIARIRDLGEANDGIFFKLHETECRRKPNGRENQ